MDEETGLPAALAKRIPVECIPFSEEGFGGNLKFKYSAKDLAALTKHIVLSNPQSDQEIEALAAFEKYITNGDSNLVSSRASPAPSPKQSFDLSSFLEKNNPYFRNAPASIPSENSITRVDSKKLFNPICTGSQVDSCYHNPQYAFRLNNQSLGLNPRLGTLGDTLKAPSQTYDQPMQDNGSFNDESEEYFHGLKKIAEESIDSTNGYGLDSTERPLDSVPHHQSINCKEHSSLGKEELEILSQMPLLLSLQKQFPSSKNVKVQPQEPIHCSLPESDDSLLARKAAQAVIELPLKFVEKKPSITQSKDSASGGSKLHSLIERLNLSKRNTQDKNTVDKVCLKKKGLKELSCSSFMKNLTLKTPSDSIQGLISAKLSPKNSKCSVKVMNTSQEPFRTQVISAMTRQTPVLAIKEPMTNTRMIKSHRGGAISSLKESSYTEEPPGIRAYYTPTRITPVSPVSKTVPLFGSTNNHPNIDFRGLNPGLKFLSSSTGFQDILHSFSKREMPFKSSFGKRTYDDESSPKDYVEPLRQSSVDSRKKNQHSLFLKEGSRDPIMNNCLSLSTALQKHEVNMPPLQKATIAIAGILERHKQMKKSNHSQKTDTCSIASVSTKRKVLSSKANSLAKSAVDPLDELLMKSISPRTKPSPVNPILTSSKLPLFQQTRTSTPQALHRKMYRYSIPGAQQAV